MAGPDRHQSSMRSRVASHATQHCRKAELRARAMCSCVMRSSLSTSLSMIPIVDGGIHCNRVKYNQSEFRGEQCHVVGLWSRISDISEDLNLI